MALTFLSKSFLLFSETWMPSYNPHRDFFSLARDFMSLTNLLFNSSACCIPVIYFLISPMSKVHHISLIPNFKQLPWKYKIPLYAYSIIFVGYRSGAIWGCCLLCIGVGLFYFCK